MWTEKLNIYLNQWWLRKLHFVIFLFLPFLAWLTYWHKDIYRIDAHIWEQWAPRKHISNLIRGREIVFPSKYSWQSNIRTDISNHRVKNFLQKQKETDRNKIYKLRSCLKLEENVWTTENGKKREIRSISWVILYFYISVFCSLTDGKIFFEIGA